MRDYWVWYGLDLSALCCSVPIAWQLSQGSAHMDLFLLSTTTCIWSPGRRTRDMHWHQLSYQAAGKSSTSAVSSMARGPAPPRASSDTKVRATKGRLLWKRERPMMEAVWGTCGVSMPVSQPVGRLSKDTALQLDTTLLLAHPSGGFLLFSTSVLGASRCNVGHIWIWPERTFPGTQRCPNNHGLFRSHYISDVILYSCMTYANSAYHTQVSDKETAASASLAFGCNQCVMTVWLPLNSPYPWHTWDSTQLLSHIPKEGRFYSESMRRDRSFQVFMVYSSGLWRLTLIAFKYLTLVAHWGGTITSSGARWTDSLRCLPYISPRHMVALSQPRQSQ